MYQGKQLLPEARGKEVYFIHCMACHGFESRMAAVVRDEDGWRDRVNYMKDAMGFFVMDPRFGFNDQKSEDVVFYINHVFGEDSVLPKSPADLPNYKDEVRPFTDEAMKIVYVEYELPGPNRMPWSAHPDKDGKFWIPYYGRANKIGRLDPATGVIEEFPVPQHRHRRDPFRGAGARRLRVAHRAGLQQARPLGPGDPEDHRVSRTPCASTPSASIAEPAMVWSTGGLSRFDPEDRDSSPTSRRCRPPTASRSTRTATPGSPSCSRNGRIGKVDAKTLKVTKYHAADRQRPAAPHPGRRRRHRLVRRVRRRQDRPLRSEDRDVQGVSSCPARCRRPTRSASMRDHKVWYSSEYMDVVGRLDPATGEVIEYPFPHAENSMRDFFLDDKGRMWFGSPANDRVGIFLSGEVRFGLGFDDTLQLSIACPACPVRSLSPLAGRGLG